MRGGGRRGQRAAACHAQAGGCRGWHPVVPLLTGPDALPARSRPPRRPAVLLAVPVCSPTGADCSLSTLTPGARPAPTATPRYTATAIADVSFLSHPEAHAAARYAPPLPGAAAAPVSPPSTGEADYVVVAAADIAAAAGREAPGEGEGGEGGGRGDGAAA